MKGRITSAHNELVYLANILVEYERRRKKKEKRHEAGRAEHSGGVAALPKELKYEVFSHSIMRRGST